MNCIYLDYAATTPLSDNVKKNLQKILFESDIFGNSGSSTHEYGFLAQKLIDSARNDVANTLAVLPREIVFTSGATESNNLAIKGVADNYAHIGRHIITSKIEHKAVLEVCQYLETKGYLVTYLEPDSHGNIAISDIEDAIKPETILVSLMAVNNELGTKNNLLAIGELTKKNKIIFHVDAAQGYGKIGIDIKAMNIDLLSVSAHKIYGPKGTGFLYVRSKAPRIKLTKQSHGGAQEFGMKAGTLATHQISALATAAKDIFANKQDNNTHIKMLRESFLQEIKMLDGITINTVLDNSYAGILNITFAGIKGETLLAMCDDLAMSMGSACNSSAIEPSHVLTAIGLTAEDADATIRISFGMMTSIDDVSYAVRKIKEKVELLRALQPQGDTKNV